MVFILSQRLQPISFGTNNWQYCYGSYGYFLFGFGMISFSFKLFVNWNHFSLKIRSQNIHDIDFSVVISLWLTVYSMLVLFLYCFFGKLAIDSFAKMPDCVFKMNWQKLPVRLQKYVILMIADMQIPIYYHGFEVAIIDLRTFIGVSSWKSDFIDI